MKMNIIIYTMQVQLAYSEAEENTLQNNDYDLKLFDIISISYLFYFAWGIIFFPFYIFLGII